MGRKSRDVDIDLFELSWMDFVSGDNYFTQWWGDKEIGDKGVGTCGMKVWYQAFTLSF
jgi:hypothetical protein